jgi:hypothetical protein
MKKKSLLEGKSVRVFVDGGWEITGSVIHDKKDRLILVVNDETALIFKSKISALLISKLESHNTDENLAKSNEDVTVEKNFVVFKSSKQTSATQRDERSGPLDNRGGDLSEGGISLPHEVLLSDPVPAKLRARTGSDDDFSISMTSLLGNSNKSRISVTLDDE